MKVSSQFYHLLTQEVSKNLLCSCVFIIAAIYCEFGNNKVKAITPKASRNTGNESNIIYLVPENKFPSPEPVEQSKGENQVNISVSAGSTLAAENPQNQNTEKPSSLPLNSNSDTELNLKVRPKPVEGITEIPEKPSTPTTGFLRANVGYFNSSNIFSLRDNPINDGLIFSGLTLSSTYLPVSNSTYINASIDANLIRYINQSTYSYNQLRFNVGVYQQLSKEMYAELGFSNQQLFYAQNSDFFSAGDRLLNENSVRLSLGRRDNLSQKLALDSSYQVSANFSDPNSRSRVINSFAVGLSYDLSKSLQLGLNYQFNLSNFTEQYREDKFHRVYTSLNFDVSKNSNLSLQSGFSFGDSTASNLDFSSWFFTVNYGFDLGRF